jgi:hypothetical protein
VYGLGNFVFCSQGRYGKIGAPPYSLVAALHIVSQESGEIGLSLRLYPIVTDNLQTGYQSRFVSQAELKEVRDYLLADTDASDHIVRRITVQKDTYGYHFVLPIRLSH